MTMSVPALVTTTTAMAALGRNRDQVVRLVETGLLPETGRHGRTRLLDAAALAELASRPVLSDSGGATAGAEPYALAVHLGPRAPETNRFNGRDWLGWDARGPNLDAAWTGWWNTGEQIAHQCATAGLPVLPAVSGFVVEVRVITGWDPHPVYPGLVRFRVAPASEQLRARYARAAFRPSAGAPWQRLWQPPARTVLAPVHALK